MAEKLSHCPNCGTEWPTGIEVCPDCGYVRPGALSWPPAPIGRVETQLPPMSPQMPRLVTGKVWGDVMLGVGITLASYVVYCLGLIVMPILYFSLRPQHPAFARGIGYGLLGGIVIALGALGVCFYSMASNH